MKVLDTHGNYGAVVRFTNSEWNALSGILKESDDE